MADKLSSSPVWPTIAVKDLKRSRDFYEGILGYQPMPMMENNDEAIAYKGAGSTGVLIYPPRKMPPPTRLPTPAGGSTISMAV